MKGRNLPYPLLGGHSLNSSMQAFLNKSGLNIVYEKVKDLP